MSEPPPELFRRWVHVAEDDEADVRVFRPFDHPIPPGRGRDGLEFRPDGTATRFTVGATDAPVRIDGRWRCPTRDEVYTDCPPDGNEAGFRIESVDDAELRLRPMP